MGRLWNVVIQRSLMITLAGLVIVLASSSADAQCGPPLLTKSNRYLTPFPSWFTQTRANIPNRDDQHARCTNCPHGPR